MLFGERDDRVRMDETQEIFRNLRGVKKLVTYPDFGHDLFNGNEIQWEKDVKLFLTRFPWLLINLVRVDDVLTH